MQFLMGLSIVFTKVERNGLHEKQSAKHFRLFWSEQSKGIIGVHAGESER